ncbi:piggyBac transposable element-derived protein 4-like [Schistocerca serialis cubense]|uniref:piggyBac transposable element-derived protein 4-like n=1 Tax=Schistocerca serialis cubense TaxID=2023355 RepID=UPI00214EA294|nr:piggyBac transposable element-derived protein 4-like [Schistocerca serialis cubense]
MFEFSVAVTNRYAKQKIASQQLSHNTGLMEWKETNTAEIKCFCGIIIWVGLIKFPNLALYWSKSMLYSNKVSSIMSHNWFEILLKLFHTSKNETTLEGDKLHKVQPLLDLIVPKFKDTICPSFRRRPSFWKYVPNIRHRYGVKVSQLCLPHGCTWNLKVRAGKEQTTGVCVPQKVVMESLDPFLHNGRILYCDNWKNRKDNPQTVISAKLKKGQTARSQSKTKPSIIKWKDKSGALIISTKHNDNMVPVKCKNDVEVLEPKAVVDYNATKLFIDVSNQVSSAYS